MSNTPITDAYLNSDDPSMDGVDWTVMRKMERERQAFKNDSVELQREVDELRVHLASIRKSYPVSAWSAKDNVSQWYFGAYWLVKRSALRKAMKRAEVAERELATMREAWAQFEKSADKR